MNSVDAEQEKYSACYALETYHMQGARLVQVKQDMLQLEPGCTYLDVGCGRGETVRMARERNVEASGLELVPELCGEHITHGRVTAMPFEADAFDVVSCYDMLEHLPTEQVDDALDELWRVARHTLVLSTNNKQSRLVTPDGFLELHLTRKPRAWWQEKFDARGGDMVASEYGNDEWHWRISL